MPSSSAKLKLSPDTERELLITEYKRLWDDFLRSANAIEAWARFFLLISGAYIAGVGAIAGILLGESNEFSSSGVLAIGLAIVPLSVLSVLTCSYIANERGSRIELLLRLGEMRKQAADLNPVLKNVLPRFPEPRFQFGFLSGDWSRYWLVAVISSFLFPTAFYLTTESPQIAEATQYADVSIPWPSCYVLLTFLTSFTMHWLLSWWILRRWQKRILS